MANGDSPRQVRMYPKETGGMYNKLPTDREPNTQPMMEMKETWHTLPKGTCPHCGKPLPPSTSDLAGKL